MKDTKTVIKLFSVLDRKGMEEYMEAQAREGWMLEKIGLCYHFRKCEPKNLKFSVVYYPAASFFDPEPSEKELTFRDFCEYSGWKVAASNGSMLIFYSEEADAIPIETDIEIESRSVSKAILPITLVDLGFLLIGLIYQMLLILILAITPISFFVNNALIVSQICLIGGLGTVVADLAIYLVWFLKARKAVQIGAKELPEMRCPRLSPLAHTLILASQGLDLFSISGRISPVIPYLAGVVLVIAACYLFTVFLKALKASKRLNMIVSFAFCLLTTLVFCGALVFGLQEYALNRHYTEPIEVNGKTRQKYVDPIPLRLQNLETVDGDRYNQYLNQEKNSMFLRYVDCTQTARIDQLGKLPQPRTIKYEVLKVKAPFLYDVCKKDLESSMLKSYGQPEEYDPNYDKHVPIDASEWGAKEAYQLYIYDEPEGTYLLCYEKHIVLLTYWADEEHPLTQEMKKAITEKLTEL